jgi:hypothetical protein
LTTEIAIPGLNTDPVEYLAGKYGKTEDNEQRIVMDSNNPWFDPTINPDENGVYFYYAYAFYDYTDYTVTKTGSGASGTWGISISGNAATADKLNSSAGSSTKAIYFSGGKPV